MEGLVDCVMSGFSADEAELDISISDEVVVFAFLPFLLLFFGVDPAATVLEASFFFFWEAVLVPALFLLLLTRITSLSELEMSCDC